MEISAILSLIISSELDQINMEPIGNYTEPNSKKKITKIGSQLAKKSGNIDTKIKNKIKKFSRIENLLPFFEVG